MLSASILLVCALSVNMFNTFNCSVPSVVRVLWRQSEFLCMLQLRVIPNCASRFRLEFWRATISSEPALLVDVYVINPMSYFNEIVLDRRARKSVKVGSVGTVVNTVNVSHVSDFECSSFCAVRVTTTVRAFGKTGLYTRDACGQVSRAFSRVMKCSIR